MLHVITNLTCLNQAGLPHPNPYTDYKLIPSGLALTTIFSILKDSTFMIIFYFSNSFFDMSLFSPNIILFLWNYHLSDLPVHLSFQLHRSVILKYSMCTKESIEFMCLITRVNNKMNTSGLAARLRYWTFSGQCCSCELLQVCPLCMQFNWYTAVRLIFL